MAVLDRRTALCEQEPPPVVTGIDFIQVVDPADQTVLRVYFLIDPEQLSVPIVNAADLPVDVSTDTVTIVSVSGGERLAQVPVVGATYKQAPLDGRMRTVLDVQTAEPGDFSIYRLFINDERIDRFFNNVQFSFKQGCPSDLDCRLPESECPPEEFVDFPVDYLARDFVSFRSALLDFAAQRYPQWTEKIEADAGVMLAEVMAALGDEFSYIQDRYAREAYLETASQRRSLRWHTRLVDYAIHDGLSAATILAVTVVTGGHLINAGTRVWATPEGEFPIPFEIDEGLQDQRDGRTFWVHSAWNAMPVHVPDQNHVCLEAGATELFIRDDLPTSDQIPDPNPDADPVPPEHFWIGRWMVLKASPEDPSLPQRRYLVRIIEVERTEDPLCPDLKADPDNPPPLRVTRIRWDDAQALPFDLCLSDTWVCGNVVPATAGETFIEHFVIHTNDDLPADAEAVPAVERQGPCNELTGERSPVFLYSLKQTDYRGLGWLGALRHAAPEIDLEEVHPSDLTPLPEESGLWNYRRSLLGSLPQSPDFTLDDGTWRRVIGFRRLGEVVEHRDYAGGSGLTVRFGDGEFGKIPVDGTVFRVRYRTDPGTRANLAADTVTRIDDPSSNSSVIWPTLAGIAGAVTNTFAITSGVDPEDPAVIKQQAPEAYRAETFRAVRDEDYAEIAERLPWVQRAGATARWTGSWLTRFVTPDPLGAFELSAERRRALENTLDCARQTGHEVHVRDPNYANLDLDVTICIQPFAFAGQVKERVVAALTGKPGTVAANNFFHPDNFTFGTPLERAALEAAIQAVPGVRGVEAMSIRARGITDWRPFDEFVFAVGHDRIIRLQNDPRFPERGSLAVRTMTEVQA